MITQSDIGEGDRLGAQMGSLASLLWLGRLSGHEVVFHSEVRHASQGLQFYDVFDLNVRLLPSRRFSLPTLLFVLARPTMRSFWADACNPRRRLIRMLAFAVTRIAYRLLQFQHGRDFVVPRLVWGPRLHCDKTLIALLSNNKNRNFDIPNGRLGSYQDWKSCERDILAHFCFKAELLNAACRRIADIRAAFKNVPDQKPKELVAVHFRLTDYLTVSSLNLTETYYREALTLFDSDKFAFLVFSDDIERCHSMPIFSEHDVTFIDHCPAGESMCLMTLCDHAIIANSSYSFWGAMLNNNSNKKVVCPREFAGPGFPANGLWYPEDWIALPVQS